MKYLFIKRICFIAICFQISMSYAQAPSFRHFTVKDGLPSNIVYHTMQDHEGYLWIATASGVVRYDGKNFENPFAETPLTDPEVLRIYEDSRQRIWCLTFSRRVTIYDHGIVRNEVNDSLCKMLSANTVGLSFFEASDSTIWFGEYGRLTKLTKEGEYKKFKSESGESIIPLEDESHQIYFLETDGLHRLSGDTFVHHIPRYLPVLGSISRLDNHTITFQAKKGIVMMKDTAMRLIIPADEKNKLSQSNLYHNNVDGRGRFWSTALGSENICYDSTTKSFFSFLPDRNVSLITIDDENNIWFPTLNDGLYMIPALSENISLYNTLSGLEKNPVHSIAIAKDSTVYAGAGKATLYHISETEIRKFNLGDVSKLPLEINDVELYKGKICAVVGGDPVIASINENTGSIQRSDIISYEATNAKDFLVADNSNLYLRTINSIYKVENLTDQSCSLTLILKVSSRIYAAFIDGDENICYALSNGLFFHDREGEKRIELPENIFTSNISHINMSDDWILCCTRGHGLVILKDKRFLKQFTTEQGISDNFCVKSLRAGENRLVFFIATSKTIDFVDLNKQVAGILFNKNNGLISDEINDMIFEGGKLYVSSYAGLCVLPTVISINENQAPPFYIQSFLINDSVIDHSLPLDLRTGQNNISISFIGISLGQPDKVQYAYRLHEEDEWSFTSDNSLIFRELNSGSYELSVKAQLPGSDWSETKTISFNIATPFIRKPAFYILATFLVSLLIGSVIFVRSKSVQRKQREKYVLERRMNQLEQQAKQALMNPHFVFNVMHSIQHLIQRNEKDAAVRYLNDFAQLMRSHIHTSGKTFLSLEEELLLLKQYVSLEQLRFGNKLNVEWQVDPQIDEYETQIPAMILQPLVENAIIHALLPLDGGNLRVRIDKVNENQYRIKIEDDGVGLTNSQQKNQNTLKHKSISLEFIRQRFELISKSYQQKISFEISQIKDDPIRGGTRIVLLLPVYYSQE